MKIEINLEPLNKEKIKIRDKNQVVYKLMDIVSNHILNENFDLEYKVVWK